MREQETKSKQFAGNPSQDGEHGSGQSNSDSSSTKLKPVERFFAVLFLGLWLNLFAGGMLVHTEPYRCIISREGVVASQPLSNRSDICKESEKPPAPMSGFWFSWFVVLFLYLPLNLALICVIAGALGTFGSIANLHADGSNNSPRDYSNPYMSGLLRGFFVYLFLISGLFLFDDDPFSNPSPNQYIRLAGFLSLFSFIVNYQPNTFSTLID